MKFDDFRQWHVSVAEKYSKYVLARREFKRLQPTENKLSGEKVPGLIMVLRNGDQVITDLLFYPNC